MLPSTILRGQEAVPEPPATTLLDSNDKNIDIAWNPSRTFANPRDSIFATHDRLQLTASWVMNGHEEYSDLRRTPSGIFMLCEEDGGHVVAASLFDQVVDAVNTAKDIAYVLWDVGWR